MAHEGLSLDRDLETSKTDGSPGFGVFLNKNFKLPKKNTESLYLKSLNINLCGLPTA